MTQYKYLYTFGPKPHPALPLGYKADALSTGMRSPANNSAQPAIHGACVGQ